MSQMPPPAAPPMGYQAPPPAKPQGMAIASLVCGILSIVLFCFWFISIPLGIVAAILGGISKGKAQRGEAGGEGLAKTGMILGIIGAAISLLLVVLAFAGMSVLEKKMPQLQQQIEQKVQEAEQAAQDAAAEAERRAQESTPTTSPSAP